MSFQCLKFLLVTFNLFLVMFGVEAARHVNERFTGHSIHRRGTRTTSGFIDGHCRMTDHVIREIQADSNYLLGLGVEFANLDPAIFGEFYSCLEDSVNQNMPTRFGTAPMLVTIENGGPVGDALRKTVMFSIIRNYMGKIKLPCCHGNKDEDVNDHVGDMF